MEKTIKFGGIDWIVLDKDDSKVLVLAKESICNKAYDEDNSNNWKNSSLRKYLNGTFLEELGSSDADLEKILFSGSDLTADDGLTDYGTCNDAVTLLTCDQYRKYRKLIPNLDNWWWLLTPYSTESNGYTYYVRSVDTNGTLSGDGAYVGDSGVRPALYLKSDILKSDPSLSGFSTEELLKEVLRRNGTMTQEIERR